MQEVAQLSQFDEELYKVTNFFNVIFCIVDRSVFITLQYSILLFASGFNKL